jgi:hypothetical protein
LLNVYVMLVLLVIGQLVVMVSSLYYIHSLYDDDDDVVLIDWMAECNANSYKDVIGSNVGCTACPLGSITNITGGHRWPHPLLIYYYY